MDITYKSGPTAKLFHRSAGFVRAIMGPIGSGKSVACIMEMLRKSFAQAPFEGVRKTRWVVVRNTYRELLDTTIKTFFDWVPEELGHYSNLHNQFSMSVELQDGTIADIEFLFRALDRPDDVKKLLSLEVTGMFINEARELPKAIIDMGMGRLGRYPSKREGGPSWFGLIMDTNPPDTDHWWYKLFEETRPSNYELFRQPGGKTPAAENIENLPANYYDNMIPGKDPQWVEVYVNGNYGFIADGKPVWTEYKDRIHAVETDYVVEPSNGPVYVGIDFGLTPAAVFAQLTVSGRLVVFDELCTFDMGAMSFGRLLKERIQRKYGNCTIEAYGDPAGDQRAQTDETTPFMVLQQQGVYAMPTYTNDFMIRREAVADLMTRLDFNGDPAFCITPGAPTLRKALAGGYKYKRMQVAGQERFQDRPDKGAYSHAGDSLTYLVLGAIGGDRVVGGYGKQEIDYSVSDRMVV